MKMSGFLLLFYFITSISYGVGVYPKELDINKVRLDDLLSELSKYSDYTIMADSQCSDIIIDFFLKEKMDIEYILKMIEETHYLYRVKSEKHIIMRNKKFRESNILVGKVYGNNGQIEIENVDIILKGGNKYETKTGRNGEFLLENIPDGIYFFGINSKEHKYSGEFIEIKKGINKKEINIDIKSEKKYKHPLEEIKHFYEKDDIIENISLNSIGYKEGEAILKDVFAEKLRVSKSHNSNTLILFGKGKDVYNAINLLKKLDIKNKQVRVVAEVIDVKENTFEDIGFNWSYNTKEDFSEIPSGITIGSLTESYTDGLGSVIGSTIGFVGKFNSGSDILNINFDLLQTTQELRVNALPSIILLNKEPGEFKMVEEVIVGEEREENEDNDRVIYEPIFKEAGIILKVIPDIKNNNEIYLSLDFEVSDFKLKREFKSEEDKENDGTFNSEGGSKVSRKVKTKIRVKNKELILIGGLKRKVNQNTRSKVPVLGEIPVVGNLFKRKSTREEYTDLYIKLKAEIIEET